MSKDFEKEKKIEDISAKDKISILKKEIIKSLSNDYDITQKTAEELTKLKFETSKNKINDLKKYLENNKEIIDKDKNKILSLTQQELEKLYNSVKWAEKLISNEDLEKIEFVYLEKNDELSKKIFPKLFEKAINPIDYKDQIIWLWLWSIDSIYTTSKLVYDVGKWIVKTPKHIYLILSNTWTYKNIERKIFLLYLFISFTILVYILFEIL